MATRSAPPIAPQRFLQRLAAPAARLRPAGRPRRAAAGHGRARADQVAGRDRRPPTTRSTATTRPSGDRRHRRHRSRSRAGRPRRGGQTAGSAGGVKKGLPGRTEACPGQAAPGRQRPVLAAVHRVQRRQRRRHLQGRHRQRDQGRATGCSTRRASSRRWPRSPAPACRTPPTTVKRTVQALADYFNKRFQFYGRKIEIDFYDGKGSNTTELLGEGREKAEADAITVAEEIGAFADLSATSRALRRRPRPTARSSASATRTCRGKWHEEHRPYTWSIATDGTDGRHRVAAEYAVQAPRAARPSHAGGRRPEGQAPQASPRFAPENSWYQESVAERRGRSSRRPARSRATTSSYQLDLGTMSNQATNIIPRLQERGHHHDPLRLRPDPARCSSPAWRTASSYYPEFIIVGTALTDADIVGQLWNQEFGQARLRRELARRRSCRRPRRSPTPPTSRCARTSPPSPSTSSTTRCTCWRSASRWPGPNLTPQTFEAGMFGYPPQARPARPLGLRPERLHRGQRRPRDLLGPERHLDLQRQEGRVHRARAGHALEGERDPRRRPDHPGQVSAAAPGAAARWKRLSRASARPRSSAPSSCVYGVARHRHRRRRRRRRTRCRFGIVVIGVITGTVTALLAIGLILIYRTNRFINFAYGAMGSLAGVIAIGLAPRERLAVLRSRCRSAWSSASSSARSSSSSSSGASANTSRLDPHRGQHRPRPDPRRHRAGIGVEGARVRRRSPAASTIPLDLAVRPRREDARPATRCSSCWSCRRCSPAWPGSCSSTDAGVAVRAAAENADRALLLGIPIRRLSTIVWMIAGGARRPHLRAQGAVHRRRPRRRRPTGPPCCCPPWPPPSSPAWSRCPSRSAPASASGSWSRSCAWNTPGSPSIQNVVFLVVILGALLAAAGQADPGPGGRHVVVVGHRRGQAHPASSCATCPRCGAAEGRARRRSSPLAVVFVPPRGGASATSCLAAFAIVWAHGRRVARHPHRLGRPHQPRPVRHRRRRRHGRRQPRRQTATSTCSSSLLAGRRGRRAGRAPRRPARAAHPRPVPRGHDAGLRRRARQLRPQPQQLPRPASPPTSARPLLWERFDLEDELRHVPRCAWRSSALSILVAIGVRKARSGPRADRHPRQPAGGRRRRGADHQRQAVGVPARRRHRRRRRRAARAAACTASARTPTARSTPSPCSPPRSSAASARSAAPCSACCSSAASRRSPPSATCACCITGTGLLVVLFALPGGLGQLLLNVRDRYLRRVANRRGILVPSLVADKRADEATTAEDTPRTRSALLEGALSDEASEEAARKPTTAERAGEQRPRTATADDRDGERRRCSRAAASTWPTARCRSSSTSTSTSPRARSSPCSAPTAPASPRCSRASAAW